MKSTGYLNRLRIDKDIEWYSIDRCDGGMNGLRFIG
jgi:hypothetical protein